MMDRVLELTTGRKGIIGADAPVDETIEKYRALVRQDMRVKPRGLGVVVEFVLQSPVKTFVKCICLGYLVKLV